MYYLMLKLKNNNLFLFLIKVTIKSHNVPMMPLTQDWYLIFHLNCQSLNEVVLSVFRILNQF